MYEKHADKIALATLVRGAMKCGHCKLPATYQRRNESLLAGCEFACDVCRMEKEALEVTEPMNDDRGQWRCTPAEPLVRRLYEWMYLPQASTAQPSADTSAIEGVMDRIAKLGKLVTGTWKHVVLRRLADTCWEASVDDKAGETTVFPTVPAQPTSADALRVLEEELLKRATTMRDNASRIVQSLDGALGKRAAAAKADVIDAGVKTEGK